MKVLEKRPIVKKNREVSLILANFHFSPDLGYNENVVIGRKKKALGHIEKEVFSSEKASYKK